MTGLKQRSQRKTYAVGSWVRMQSYLNRTICQKQISQITIQKYSIRLIRRQSLGL